MDKKEYKKAGEIATNKIIVIILLAIVIIAFLVFLFKVPIINYFKNLPDYSINENDTLIIVNSTDSSIISKVCNEQVGKLIDSQLVFKEYGFFKRKVAGVMNSLESGSNSAFIFVSGETTDLRLFLEGNTKKNNIELYRSLIFQDPTVGYIDSNGKIIIQSKWIDDDNLRAKYDNVPSKAELKKIDGAYIKNNVLICR